MSENKETYEESIARLEGIDRFVNELEKLDYTWLHLPTIYEYDPVAETPFVLSNSFIPEDIGGNITIREADGDTLGQENLNQMLGSFLPGGFKQRWGTFDLWRGNYEVLSDSPGVVNIYPMFATNQVYSLDSRLDDVDYEQFTSLGLDPDQVLIYIPEILRVKKLKKRRTRYFWATNHKVVTAGQSEPPMANIELSSDPTTNYLWFKQLLSREDGEQIELSSEALVPACEFVSDVEFLRAYYASLLTLYTRRSNNTLSRIITYRHGRDGPPAFVGSHERSQALFFDLDRPELRSCVTDALATDSILKRDLQVAKLYRLVWDRLFFEANGELLEHVFAVRPFVDQLLGVDYWSRRFGNDEDGVFALDADEITETLQELLPEDSYSRLRSMGYGPQPPIFDILSEQSEILEEILAECNNDEKLLEFAEEVALHSLEHALSTWATERTASGGSLELWYDMNVQARDTDTTTLGIYDPIQGGAGVAKEIFTELSATPDPIDDRLGAQGICHTATTDRTVLRFLASAPGDTLYSLSTSDPEEFSAQIRTAVKETVAGTAEEYNEEDLTAHVETRLRSILETREIARFNAYIGDLHKEVADTVGRTPRPVDVVLHLDQHFFRDPRIATTYERFRETTERRDLSELAERIEAITMQCVSACPDCLKVKGSSCVHGMKYQTKLLNRRLLTAISDTQ